jgi:predicted metal-dependent phosphoesterase TrpH
MFADLHLHSQYSDGTYTPAELAEAARKHGLKVIALTDHDTVEGCELTREECLSRGMEFIPGVELTAEFEGDELHLLGYFLDTQNPELLGELAKYQLVRQNRVREMVARLNHLSIPLTAEAVFALAQCRSPGRPHVGRALVQAGICANLDQAFDRFLKKHRPAWVPKFKMSAEAGIGLIHRAGGLAVMAHPGLNHCDKAIPGMVEAGLDGIECFHSKHSESAAAYYLEVTEHYGLLVTGGSDCHGMSKGRPTMGQVLLPYAYIEKMYARMAEMAKNAVKGPQAEQSA